MSKNRKSKDIRKQIWEKFGWSMRVWASRRGLKPHDLYNFLYGKAGRKTSKRIVEMLQKDGISRS
ncbi:hypothetical protein SAMN04488516_1177 [Desulfonauticus submarinus]|uniref:Phage-associated protein, BcepMu gp16 family n=1 Tax=Desulfonauticus submarinus TaxID=206665 RepID=A0A1H0G8P4_9BACT|nr:hypothetical protein [Desulfonauticus submarinus]SDO03275.1 hypothetical protein SAMN04488516_1177 [Desulfonauticus submarinus]